SALAATDNPNRALSDRGAPPPVFSYSIPEQNDTHVDDDQESASDYNAGPESETAHKTRLVQQTDSIEKNKQNRTHQKDIPDNLDDLSFFHLKASSLRPMRPVTLRARAIIVLSLPSSPEQGDPPMSSPIAFHQFDENECRTRVRAMSDEELLRQGKQLRS